MREAEEEHRAGRSVRAGIAHSDAGPPARCGSLHIHVLLLGGVFEEEQRRRRAGACSCNGSRTGGRAWARVSRPAVDVAAHVVLVVALHRRRSAERAVVGREESICAPRRRSSRLGRGSNAQAVCARRRTRHVRRGLLGEQDAWLLRHGRHDAAISSSVAPRWGSRKRGDSSARQGSSLAPVSS